MGDEDRHASYSNVVPTDEWLTLMLQVTKNNEQRSEGSQDN